MKLPLFAFGKQKKKESVIGAITSRYVSDLKVPVGKISTSLAGQMAGMLPFNVRGEPGSGADFWILGLIPSEQITVRLFWWMVLNAPRPCRYGRYWDILHIKRRYRYGSLRCKRRQRRCTCYHPQRNFENHRYYDIRTWMIATTGKQRSTFLDANWGLRISEDSWKRTRDLFTHCFRIQALFFPIHQNQLNEMKNITQNYGW